MARQTAMAQAAEAEAKAKGTKPPLMDPSEWDAAESPEYGGQADIMELAVGEIGGPFTYSGHQEMALEGNSKPVTVHIGITEDGNNMRLPIAASFLRAVDQAGIKPGDQFAIKRLDDVKKKAGVGKGTMMQIYSVKVLKKAASGSPA